MSINFISFYLYVIANNKAPRFPSKNSTLVKSIWIVDWKGFSSKNDKILLVGYTQCNLCLFYLQIEMSVYSKFNLLIQIILIDIICFSNSKCTCASIKPGMRNLPCPSIIWMNPLWSVTIPPMQKSWWWYCFQFIHFPWWFWRPCRWKFQHC